MMPTLTRSFRLFAATGTLILVLVFGPVAAHKTARAENPSQPVVQFDRQVRSILAENCFACHGPDSGQRKAKLRLDTKEGAFARLREGGFAIVPGKSAESELISRVTSD